MTSSFPARMPRTALGRRRFVAGAAGLAAATVIGRPQGAEAAVQCSAFDWQGLQYCDGGIPSTIVGQSARPQYQSQWCWAACISMIFHYYGFPVSQDRVVGETFGSIVDMPADGYTILSAVNRGWLDDRRKPFRSAGQPLAIDAELARQHLVAERPLIIGALGHATVLTAMSWIEDRAGRREITGMVVRDPWYGGQRRQLTGQEIWGASFLALVVASRA